MFMNSDKTGRERRRLKKLLAGEKNGRFAPGTVENSMNAWKANADRGDTFFKVKRMQQYFIEQEWINNGN